MIGCLLLASSILLGYDAVIVAGAAVLLIGAYWLAHIRLDRIIRRMRGLWLLLGLSFIFQCALTEGTVWFEVAGVDIAREGVVKGGITVLRLLVLLFSSFLLTMTTPPIRLASGIEKLLSPLAGIGLPVHKFAMLITLALRFVPVINEEAAMVSRAQRSRGAPLHSRKASVRIKSMSAVLIPLLAASLQRAGDLAVAMEARCYSGGVHPTRTKGLRCGRADRISWIVMGMLALLALARTKGML